jgi:hypothetical protein
LVGNTSRNPTQANSLLLLSSSFTSVSFVSYSNTTCAHLFRRGISLSTPYSSSQMPGISCIFHGNFSF